MSAWRPGEAALAPRALSFFLNRDRSSERPVPRRHHDERGFTLLEVMLAVVILGLGILGLSALFAGVARQQQTSIQVRRSVQIALNAKASLARRLGRVEGVKPNELPEGQWAWIRSSQSPTDTALDVSTIGNSGTSNAFFRVRATGKTLFTNEADFTGNAPAGAANMGTYNQSAPTPPFGNSGTSSINPLANPRVISDTSSTLTIRVHISQQGGIGAVPFDFTELNPPSPGQQIPPLTTLLRDPNDTNTFVRMRLAPNNGLDPAFIDSFDVTSLFAGLTNPWISKIEVLTYFWRNSTLLSLNERLSYVPDDRFPPAGLRPEIGYALFFRRLGEINQALVLTFSLQPQGRPRLRSDQFPFIPPDNLPPDDPDALVREIPVDIGWDSGRKQYFVRVKRDSLTAWVAAPRQILLMSSTKGFGVNTNDPGADDVVRVISQSTDPLDDQYLLGWLDDAPRTGLAAVALQRDRAGPNAGLTPIYVYAINPQVVNADPADDTRWKVSPLEARLIPIAAQ